MLKKYFHQIFEVFWKTDRLISVKLCCPSVKIEVWVLELKSLHGNYSDIIAYAIALMSRRA